MASKTGNVSLLLSCCNNLGMIARVRSDFRQAVKYWEEGLALAEKIEDHRHVAYLKNNIGNVYRELGEFSPALQQLNEGLELFRQLESDIDVRRCNRGLAILYLCLGDHEKAEEVIRRNQPGSCGPGDPIGRLMDLDVLGRVLKEKKAYKPAEVLFGKALEGYRKAGDPEDIVQGLLNLAELNIARGKNDQSVRYREEAERLARRFHLKKAYAHCLFLRGIAGMNPEETLGDLIEARRQYRELGLPCLEMRASLELGRILEREGRSREADQAFQDGAEQIQEMRRSIFKPDLIRKFETQPAVAELLSKVSG